MRFSVFALASIPDTATTRRLFDLHDLDDRSVAKVLAHRRRLQTGSSEELRWDQRAIAAITLIQHSIDNLSIESFNFAEHTEQDMLQAFYRSVLRTGHMVSWDAEQRGLPLIHFRTLMQHVSYPAYWQALRERGDLHLDLCAWLSPARSDRPTLDDLARRLGLPGMLGRDEDGVIDAWLQGRPADVQAFSDIAALNAYLIALQLFTTTGEITRHDNARIQVLLRDRLRRNDSTHLADFLGAWGEA
jgi:predicted PolB exonuclease-like 3'-5' exonuclease